MTERERHQRAVTIFHAAADMSGATQAQYVAQACAGDAELRRAVEKLLAADAQAGDTLEKGVQAQIMSAFKPANYPIGETFGDRYRIEKELGHGGMGAVYLAHDTRLHGRAVVVKVLLPAVLANPLVVDLFKKESEGLSRISHGRVVKVLDLGHAPRTEPYLVMEFVEGHTLAQEIQPGGMDLLRAAIFLRDAAQALTAAHHKEVIHRDLKTVNMMIEQPAGPERLKLIDFGIAKVANPTSANATQFPMSVGTPDYMPPEQVSGSDATPASDIYALGVVAYQMLTGVLPFVVDTRNPAWRADLLAQQSAGVKVAPQQLRPELPDAANAEILRALSFQPADRQQLAFEFGESLFRALTEGRPTPTAQLATTYLPTEIMSSAKPLTFDSRGLGTRPVNTALQLFEQHWNSATFTDCVWPSTLEAVNKERSSVTQKRGLVRGLGGKAKRVQYAYRVGAELCLSLDLRREGYLTLLDAGTDGTVYCLCPSWFAPNARLSAGPFHLPQRGAAYEAFTPDAAGKEKLLAIISDEPLGLDWMPRDADTPARILNSQDLAALSARLQQMGAARWTALAAHFEVVA